MKFIEIQRLLTSRAFFYHLFAKALYLEPNAECLQPLAADERIAAILREGALAGGEKEFFMALDAMRQYAPGDWTELRAEYLRLFDDPEHIRVCPWESVYLSREHVIFDEHTLAVQAFYRRWGMAAPDRTAGPADHIGIECSFLAYLSEAAAGCSEKSDLCKNLSAQHLFLSEHICLYSDKFCRGLAKESVHPFYRGLAVFLRSYLAADLAALSEILKTENCKGGKIDEF